MANRPVFSIGSFLKHLFSPSKNPKPTGIRKVKLTSTKGRDRKRVASFNRMSATNQKALTESGQREEYLKGEVSFREAKTMLRYEAQSRGIVKASPSAQRTTLDMMIASHLIHTVRAAGKPVNPRSVAKNIRHLDQPTPAMLNWNYGDFLDAARDDDYVTEDANGEARNPFWYH